MQDGEIVQALFVRPNWLDEAQEDALKRELAARDRSLPRLLVGVRERDDRLSSYLTFSAERRFVVLRAQGRHEPMLVSGVQLAVHRKDSQEERLIALFRSIAWRTMRERVVGMTVDDSSDTAGDGSRVRERSPFAARHTDDRGDVVASEREDDESREGMSLPAAEVVRGQPVRVFGSRVASEVPQQRVPVAPTVAVDEENVASPAGAGIGAVAGVLSAEAAAPIFNSRTSSRGASEAVDQVHGVAGERNLDCARYVHVVQVAGRPAVATLYSTYQEVTQALPQLASDGRNELASLQARYLQTNAYEGRVGKQRGEELRDVRGGFSGEDTQKPRHWRFERSGDSPISLETDAILLGVERAGSQAVYVFAVRPQEWNDRSALVRVTGGSLDESAATVHEAGSVLPIFSYELSRANQLGFVRAGQQSALLPTVMRDRVRTLPYAGGGDVS